MSGHIGESPLNVAYELGDIPDDGVHYTNHTGEQFILRNKNPIPRTEASTIKEKKTLQK